MVRENRIGADSTSHDDTGGGGKGAASKSCGIANFAGGRAAPKARRTNRRRCFRPSGKRVAVRTRPGKHPTIATEQRAMRTARENDIL